MWVTEFCFWPEEGNANSTVSPEAQIQSMVSTVEWLETTPWIFRYAWFKPVGKSSADKGPNYGLLVQDGTGFAPWSLSPQGEIYVNIPTFDTEQWHATEQWVSAVNYVASSGVSLGHSADEESLTPIEISRFNSGAHATYQFDVPSAGKWILMLRVSGEGEKTRFNPNLGVYAVEENGEEGECLSEPVSFPLSEDDAIYGVQEFEMQLKAGKQQIRLKDAAPYTPSGIRISQIKLTQTSGMETIDTESADCNLVDVYTATGMRVRTGVKLATATAGLPSGLYIVGARKVLVRN